jgi:DNA-binding transcriptional LysR family regulator
LAIAVVHSLHHRKTVILQLRAFLAVIEEGSLHRAATRLSLSHSALSRQMQALEHELGGKLLERSSTGVRPTAGGYALGATMGTLLASYDSAMLEVRRLVRGQPDQLRISYLASAYEEYLALALKRLRQVYPRTKVKLLDLFPGEQITALRRGKIDIAITQEIGDLLGRDFYARELATTGSIVCLPAGHSLASRKQVKIAELKNETFVTGTEDRVPSYRRRLVQICRNYGKFRAKLISNSGDLSSKLAMVANEDAVALLPAYMRHQTSPGVVIVPISDARATWKLFVVWQRGKTAGPLRTLLDLLPAKTSIAAHARNNDHLTARPDRKRHGRNHARRTLHQLEGGGLWERRTARQIRAMNIPPAARKAKRSG